MLQRRLIPCLLVDSNQHLVKTTSFSNRVYIGDPRNACHIFSSFQADEIFLLDIDASNENRVIDKALIASIAQFSSVPLAVGGGIHSLQQIETILSLGVERVVLGSALRMNPHFLNQAIHNFGTSSVSVIINSYGYSRETPLARFGKSKPGRDETLHDITELTSFCESEGAGEIIVNDVLREGTGQGFDSYLFDSLSAKLHIPVIALGGGRTANDVRHLFDYTNVAGASLGSAFVYAPGTQQILLNYQQFKASISSHP